jgi:hypothetical protein
MCRGWMCRDLLSVPWCVVRVGSLGSMWKRGGEDEKEFASDEVRVGVVRLS